MFKPGDKVSIEYYDRRAFGTVTIAKEDTSKVIFDDDYDLNYDYYPNEELRLEKPDASSGQSDSDSGHASATRKGE